MPTPAKKPARKPSLRVVGQPDLAQLESVVLEAAKQQAPMVQRAASVHDKLVVEAKALEAERSEFEDRKALLTRQFEAAIQGIDNNIADIDAALALYAGGIGGQQAAE